MDISSISNSIGSLSLNNSTAKIDQSGDKSFQNMLNDAISEVNNEQVQGYDSMQGLATGKVSNLQEAVQKMEEADLSMKLALEVKNKALTAYKEIMRMQV
jgi:flagellar hook-basal body complex protein FliE